MLNIVFSLMTIFENTDDRIFLSWLLLFRRCLCRSLFIIIILSRLCFVTSLSITETDALCLVDCWLIIIIDVRVRPNPFRFDALDRSTEDRTRDVNADFGPAHAPSQNPITKQHIFKSKTSIWWWMARRRSSSCDNGWEDDARWLGLLPPLPSLSAMIWWRFCSLLVESSVGWMLNYYCA